MSNAEFINKLPEHLFWDLNLSMLDKSKNKTIIIERVFNKGDINDLKLIIQVYGIKTIEQEIIKAGFLDKKTLNFASTFLNIPKSKFKCYKKMQSNPERWNF